jgi:hypothetical protein
MGVLSNDDGGRQVGVIAGLAAVLFLVLLAPFVRTVRQVREPSAPKSLAAAPTAQESAAAGSEVPVAPITATVRAAPAETGATTDTESAVEGGDWTAYHDPDYRFSLEIPSDWSRATVEGRGGADAADEDVLFEHSGSGARLVVSVWSDREEAEFADWVADIASGLDPVDGRETANAVVAGRDALVAWSPETPTYPAQYAAFLPGDDSYYRISYTAGDGGAAMSVFIRALVTLSIDGTETLDTIPPVPMPDGNYFPNRGPDD